MLFTSAFASNHLEFQLLLFAKFHDNYWILRLSSLTVDEFDWTDLQLLLFRQNIIRSHVILLIFVLDMKLEYHGALGTVSQLAHAIFFEIEIIDPVANERYESTSVRQELVMQCRCILTDLN